MTEFSALWTTDDTTPTGHQVAGYTQAQWTTIMRVMAKCNGHPGVAPGYLGELEVVQSGAESINVADGGAIVDGKIYEANAPIGFVVSATTGGGNTRYDRVVVRANWSNFEVTVEVVTGTEAASPTEPSLTQTEGTLYEMELALILVDNSGIVSITDRRSFAGSLADNTTLETSYGALQIKDSGVSTAKIANLAVTNAKLAANAVTPAKVQNRTRYFFVPFLRANNQTDGTLADFENYRGWVFLNSKNTMAQAIFTVPSDLVGDMKVYPVFANFWTTGGGVIQTAHYLYYSQDGDEHYSVRYDSLASHSVTIPPNSQNARIYGGPVLCVAAIPGDIATVVFMRDGVLSSDTYNYRIYSYGCLVEYTADS